MSSRVSEKFSVNDLKWFFTPSPKAENESLILSGMVDGGSGSSCLILKVRLLLDEVIIWELIEL